MPPAPGHADAQQQQQQPQEAAASWRALGTLVHLVVTEPSCLPAARSLLEADLAAVDLACSRFRADSEICTLKTTGQEKGQEMVSGRRVKSGVLGLAALSPKPNKLFLVGQTKREFLAVRVLGDACQLAKRLVDVFRTHAHCLVLVEL